MAYFTVGKPVKGQDALATEWMCAKWKFTDGSSDGGELFVLACGVWLACATLLWIRRSTWMLMLAHLAARQAQR